MNTSLKPAAFKRSISPSSEVIAIRGQVGMGLANLPCYLIAVHSGHILIKYDQIVRVLPKKFQCLNPVMGQIAIDTMTLQLYFKQFAIRELIFRIENTFRCHPAAP